MMKKIAASIMCADQLHLADELKRLELAKIDLLHCDVMDGIYVNNLALGPDYLRAIKRATQIPLDIHLATVTPLKYIDFFTNLEPEYISFHIEVTDKPEKVIEHIKRHNIKASIAINPTTPISVIYPYLDQIDMVLMMTVNPGFAGQSFQINVLKKLAELKQRLINHTNPPLIEVDGNINQNTIVLMKDCLPDIFVLGTSALFHHKDNNDYSQRLAALWY